MKLFNNKVSLVVLAVVLTLGLAGPITVFAATSPTLTDSSSYSVLAGADPLTCTGLTTTTGDVGIAPGTAITGFPVPCIAGPPGTTHSFDASAIAAQAEALTVFGVLDQPCDQSFGAVDLGTTFPAGVGPGTYCSTSSFSLAGNLNLIGSGVWIFKTVSTLVFGNGSSITGGDPCNVWWRVGSSTTLGTTSSVIGNIFSQTGANAMNTNATLNGRFLALSDAAVTLDSNTITGPTCAAAAPLPLPPSVGSPPPSVTEQTPPPSNPPQVLGLSTTVGNQLQPPNDQPKVLAATTTLANTGSGLIESLIAGVLILGAIIVAAYGRLFRKQTHYKLFN